MASFELELYDIIFWDFCQVQRQVKIGVFCLILAKIVLGDNFYF